MADASHHLRTRLIVLAVVAALLAGATWMLTRRHDVHLSLEPGEVRVVTIEVTLDKPLREKSFVKEFGLPVTCEIMPPSDGRDVVHAVLETSHSLRKLRARVRVAALDGAAPGRRTYRASFTIAGEGGWKQPRIIVDVDS